MSRKLKVAIIDDDMAVLDSLGLLLKSHDFDTALFASPREFLDSGSPQKVSCVVSDVRMPEMNGLELQRAIAEKAPALPVILITGHGDIAMAVTALKGGAADFIEKPFSDERIIASIETSSKAALRRQADTDAEIEFAARVRELPPRQRQVMDLVIEGFSSKEIAIRLGLSPRTVENYRAWIMERTGAPNLAALVRMAISCNLAGPVKASDDNG